jgi:hypothetical protein
MSPVGDSSQNMMSIVPWMDIQMRVKTRAVKKEKLYAEKQTLS